MIVYKGTEVNFFVKRGYIENGVGVWWFGCNMLLMRSVGFSFLILVFVCIFFNVVGVCDKEYNFV